MNTDSTEYVIEHYSKGFQRWIPCTGFLRRDHALREMKRLMKKPGQLFRMTPRETEKTEETQPILQEPGI